MKPPCDQQIRFRVYLQRSSLRDGCVEQLCTITSPTFYQFNASCLPDRILQKNCKKNQLHVDSRFSPQTVPACQCFQHSCPWFQASVAFPHPTIWLTISISAPYPDCSKHHVYNLSNLIILCLNNQMVMCFHTTCVFCLWWPRRTPRLSPIPFSI